MRQVVSREERSARNVKAIRMRANMSQEQFAGAIGVATNTISRIETRKIPLSAEVAVKINKEFFASMDYLFGISDDEEGEPPCYKTCGDLIKAQFLIDTRDATIKVLNDELEAMQRSDN